MTKIKQTIKEFGISSWAIDNKMTVYLMIVLILITGVSAYYQMPRESFPEVKETKIYISSVFPGNTSEDMEKLITNPLEEELQNLSGVNIIDKTMPTKNAARETAMVIKNDRKSSSPHPF